MEVPNKSQTQFHLHHYGTTIFKNALNENLHLPGHQGKVRIQALPGQYHDVWDIQDGLAQLVSRLNRFAKPIFSLAPKVSESSWCFGSTLDTWKVTCWEHALRVASSIAPTSWKYSNMTLGMFISKVQSQMLWFCLVGLLMSFMKKLDFRSPKPPATSLISENHLSITESFDTQKVLGKGFLIKHNMLSLNLTQDCSF